MINKITHGDALEALKEIESDSVDLLCCDPPYSIGFMGKAWDKALPDIGIFRECLRVLKPGAFAFVMSAPRSDVCSRMAILLEDAGFNIAFTPIYWTYASGFPKAMNIGKMVDKRLGVERGRVPNPVGNLEPWREAEGRVDVQSTIPDSTPITDAAKALDGSYGGFQPKPAVEVIIVAMKPLSEKTYVDQALKNGKGITWLDSVRIPTEQGFGYENNQAFVKDGLNAKDDGRANVRVSLNTSKSHEQGRFPANLLVSDDVLNDGRNIKGAKSNSYRGGKNGYDGGWEGYEKHEGYADSGSSHASSV